MTDDDRIVDDNAIPEEEVPDERGITDDDVTDALAASDTAPQSEEVRRRGVLGRLYHGETRANIVGRWKLWFAISGAVILVGFIALATRGLNLGIDFTGGTVWQVPAGDAKVADVSDAMAKLGYTDAQVQEITKSTGAKENCPCLRVVAEATASPSTATTKALDATEADLTALADKVPSGTGRDDIEDIRNAVQGLDGPFRQDVPEPLKTLNTQVATTTKAVEKAKSSAAKTAAAKAGASRMQTQVDLLSAAETAERTRLGQSVSNELARLTGSKVTMVTVDTVGPSWGREISNKARNALIVFLIAITLYITLRFEFRMAMATLAALVHDLVIVVGIYALFGLPVTPATVIAILTILGFSIYDGIVVFDRVDENTRLVGKKSKLTYTEMANLSLNQVLMRSLNTSITALLPILSVLVIGAGVLGATTLQEFGLALFLGLMSGAYSSIFIATPMLALLKEREPRYREVRKRLEESRAASGANAPTGTSTTGSLVGAGVGAPSRPTSANAPTIVVAPPGAAPRPRKQGKKR